MAGKFAVYKDKAGEFRFRLRSSNGQTVLSSEGYSSKASAMNGIESVRKNSTDASLFEKTDGAGGKFRFVLKAKNRQTIGTSQGYQSASGRDAGIKAVARASEGATVDDQTAG